MDVTFINWLLKTNLCVIVSDNSVFVTVGEVFICQVIMESRNLLYFLWLSFTFI